MDQEGAPDDADRFGLRLANQLSFAAYSAAGELNRLWSRRLKAIGLTLVQYHALLILYEHAQITVGLLSDKLNLDFSSVTPLVQRMEIAGLVERHRDLRDERRVYVRATAKGLSLQSTLIDIEQTIARDLGVDRNLLDALRTSLHDLAKAAHDAV